MKVTNDQSPIQPEGRPNRRIRKAAVDPNSGSRPADSAEISAESVRQAKAPAEPAGARPSKAQDTIHREAVLRETVARLIESGDITAAEDGAVRRLRIDEARKKLEAGAYGQSDIIGGIVDRLLSQWKI